MRNEKLGNGSVLWRTLNSRNMEDMLCRDKRRPVKEKALEPIPKGSSINMGGATFCRRECLVSTMRFQNR